MDTKDKKLQLNQLPEVAKQLVDNSPCAFDDFVNDRQFEMQITKLSGKIDFADVSYNQVCDQIENAQNDKRVAFVLYFVYFTKYRRLKNSEARDLVKEFGENFDCYEINKHIRLLADYSAYNSVKKFGRLMRDAGELCVEPHKKLYNHVGFINLYCELTCAYYEKNLDERNEPEGEKQLKDALSSIRRAIKREDDLQEKQEKQAQEQAKKDGVPYRAKGKKAYHKFYLNMGRLLVLIGQFDEGESQMNYAIHNLPNDKDRESRIRLYESYITQASIIRTYALSDDKYKDLEKIKVNTYKTVTLTTTLLGFLLGSIKIYETVTDVFTLAMLMLAYMSLLLVMSGTVLFGLSIALRDRKRRMLVYDGILVGVGIVLFAISMVLILTYGYTS